MTPKSESTVAVVGLCVKNSAARLLESSWARPSHCRRCGVAAGMPGHLRLHGHGRRSRLLWGPPQPLAAPEAYEVSLRRFRCLDCGHVTCTRPPEIASRLLYAAAAIAVALCLWAVLAWTPARTRAAISPWRIVGASQTLRWASLRRWLQRAPSLFGVEIDQVDTASARDRARRVVQLLLARAPPELLDPRLSAFAGGHAR